MSPRRSSCFALTLLACACSSSPAAGPSDAQHASAATEVATNRATSSAGVTAGPSVLTPVDRSGPLRITRADGVELARFDSFTRNAIALESHPDAALCPDGAEAWIAGGPELAGSVVLCTRAGSERATVIVSLSRSKLDGRGPDRSSLALIHRWWTGTSEVATARTNEAIALDGTFALAERTAPASFMGSEEPVAVQIRGTAALLR